MRPLRRLGLVPVLLLSASLAGACSGDSFPSRQFVPSLENDPSAATLDLTPVHLQTKRAYGATDYVIPKAYLAGMNLWHGGVQDYIFIEAYLPSMEPWTVAGERLFQKILAEHQTLPQDNIREFQDIYYDAYFKNWVSVRVSYGHCFGHSRAQPEWIRKWGRHDDANGTSQFERYFSGSSASGIHDLLVPKSQGRFNIYIDCPEYGGSLRRCSAISDYDALVAYEFFFSAQRVDEYRAIDDKVRQLLRKFITSSRPSSAMPDGCAVVPVDSQPEARRAQ